MSISTCISHPANERLVIIRKWQVEFCDGNQCAAALLSFYEYWHTWKLNSDRYNKKSNDIAEFHGERRSLSEDVFQYHTLTELSDGILGLYGQKKISEAIKLLESKSVISIHSNPNPKFHHDKTQYFKFYPDVCNNWINSSYKSGGSKNASWMKQKGSSELAEMRDASSKNASRDGENAVYRTEINNKEINQINNTDDIYVDNDLHVIDTTSITNKSEILNEANEINVQDEIQEHSAYLKIEPHSQDLAAVISILASKGLSRDQLQQPHNFLLIKSLIKKGATPADFAKAYDNSDLATTRTGKKFGVPYLAKAVESLLLSEKLCSRSQNNSNDKHVYEENLKNAMSWAGDLL